MRNKTIVNILSQEEVDNILLECSKRVYDETNRENQTKARHARLIDTCRAARELNQIMRGLHTCKP